jgi:hypothetical protein
MLHLGANLTGTNGSVLILSPNAPSGPLNSFWAQPVAGFEYGLQKDGPERPIGVITAITKMRLSIRLRTFSFHGTFMQIWSPFLLGMRSEELSMLI